MKLSALKFIVFASALLCTSASFAVLPINGDDNTDLSARRAVLGNRDLVKEIAQHLAPPHDDAVDATALPMSFKRVPYLEFAAQDEKQALAFVHDQHTNNGASASTTSSAVSTSELTGLVGSTLRRHVPESVLMKTLAQRRNEKGDRTFTQFLLEDVLMPEYKRGCELIYSRFSEAKASYDLNRHSYFSVGLSNLGLIILPDLLADLLQELHASEGSRFSNDLSIDLSNNELTWLPDSTHILTVYADRGVSLANNQLAHIPSSIGGSQERMLPPLNLSKNNLTGLPPSIVNCHTKGLKLGGNNITKVTREVYEWLSDVQNLKGINLDALEIIEDEDDASADGAHSRGNDSA